MLKISTDFKRGTVSLKITDLDDLWYLSQIIEEQDYLTGITTRKIKLGSDDNASIIKKTFKVTIDVEKVDLAAEELRVNGTIIIGPDDIPQGSYQSISLTIGDECTIQKAEWPLHLQEQLDQASQKKYCYLLCLFDRDDAILALTKKSGFEVLVKTAGEVTKKNQAITIKKEFYQELEELLQEYNTRFQPQTIIIASPAFYKEDLANRIKNPDLKKKLVLTTASDVSERSLEEVMRRPELHEILKDSRLREEQILLEALLSAINTEGLAVYGRADVERATLAGAVKIILLTDQFIAKQKEEGTFKETNDILKLASKNQAKIHILSIQNNAGKRLEGLSGIAALLRYKLEW